MVPGELLWPGREAWEDSVRISEVSLSALQAVPYPYGPAFAGVAYPHGAISEGRLLNGAH